MEDSLNFLKFEVVWKDEHILELEVTVSNNGYSGIAHGYDTGESLQILAGQLIGFPKNNQTILYKIENSQGPRTLANLLISFREVTSTGLVGVKVELETDGSFNCQNSRVSVELLIEPYNVDIFQQYLATLATSQDGNAKLIAR